MFSAFRMVASWLICTFSTRAHTERFRVAPGSRSQGAVSARRARWPRPDPVAPSCCGGRALQALLCPSHSPVRQHPQLYSQVARSCRLTCF